MRNVFPGKKLQRTLMKINVNTTGTERSLNRSGQRGVFVAWRVRVGPERWNRYPCSSTSAVYASREDLLGFAPRQASPAREAATTRVLRTLRQDNLPAGGFQRSCPEDKRCRLTE